MIYILGDSYSFGYNFWMDNKPRKELIYGYHLSKKLNMPLTNLSVPGSSNWRMARLLSALSLNKDDVVIIGWSAIERYEIPVTKHSLSPLDKVFDTYDQNFFEGPVPPYFSQWVEKTNNLYTRRVVYNTFNDQNTVLNRNFQKLNQTLFKDHLSLEYFNDMFCVLYKACLYQLKFSNTKFLMFNAWSSDVDEKSEYNIKEYLFGPKSNMTDVIRSENSKSKTKTASYWDENEHKQVAEILYTKLKEYYDIV